MSDKNKIKLEKDCILNVPLMSYDCFSFIVNGVEFKTSRLIADLLSPKIGKIHQNDPTFNSIILNTQTKGNFSFVLQLINFSTITIPDAEIPFIWEIVGLLENKFINLKQFTQNQKINIDKAIQIIEKHEQCDQFFNENILKEIDFISSHFFEINENQLKDLASFSLPTIEKIINNDKFKIRDEDQLLLFINGLYLNDNSFSLLYEHVIFSNASSEAIDEFLQVFDINDITNEIWRRLSQRLKHIIGQKSNISNNRYKNNQKGPNFVYQNNNKFNGILNYLITKSNGNIENEINITASSCCDLCDPKNVVLYDDADKSFQSKVEPNSWICFDFKEHKVKPTSYLIRSFNYAPNSNHPKNWIIEGSKDEKQWQILDTQRECNYLNGSNLVHSFQISNQTDDSFKYIRMRLIGKSWRGEKTLRISSLEFFGTLI